VLSAVVLTARWVPLALALGWATVYFVVGLAELGGLFEPFLLSAGWSLPEDLLIAGHLLGIGLVGILGWLSAGSQLDTVAEARRNLARAQSREQELERARASLAEQVNERTRDLETALLDVQEGLFEQEALLSALHQQSIPVVPLFRHIIALPVVSVLDAERSGLLLSSMLAGIEQYDARVALLDITGVPVVDEPAAAALAKVVSGARLVGAECVLVGVNPDVASQLVDLELDQGGLVSRVDMEAGLRYALRRLDRLPDVVSTSSL
jgi:anti-anti-sigma regulatory factor